MASVRDKKILLVIGGGIAAYKALELIRRLRERGASVRGVLTSAAKNFVTPLSVASLSGQKVFDDLFNLTDEAEMGHIELSRDADLIVVAPATADLLAKQAHGLANDMASTLLLATDKKVLVAPAMNLRMWLHPATQRNVAQLKQDGVLFIGPDNGEMACGEFGPGRMAEPLAIVAAIEQAFEAETALILPANVPQRPTPTGPLSGKHVVITSGPTHEPIDPVRYIANRSSGKQGYALAVAARAAGAEVTLVSGPVNLPAPEGIKILRVETAREMFESVEAALPADLFIAAAAVADWRVAGEADQKIKKGALGNPSFSLVENPDILASVSKSADKRPKIVIGFAAETEKVIAHAQAKLARKGCDLIVANDVAPGTGVMGGNRNTVHLVTPNNVTSWPEMSKDEVATRLITHFAEMLNTTGAQK